MRKQICVGVQSFSLLIESHGVYVDKIPGSSRSHGTGIVIELAHSRKDSDMEADAGKALQQIENQHGVRELFNWDCKRFYGYGIAFSGRRCFITRREISSRGTSRREAGMAPRIP